jgi:hypothetical protein
MTFVLTIETDNAAFDDSPEYEVARILRKIAERVQAEGMPLDGKCIAARDTNGNRCGSAFVDGG